MPPIAMNCCSLIYLEVERFNKLAMLDKWPVERPVYRIHFETFHFQLTAQEEEVSTSPFRMCLFVRLYLAHFILPVMPGRFFRVRGFSLSLSLSLHALNNSL